VIPHRTALALALALCVSLASCRSLAPDPLAPARAALADGRPADAAAAAETALRESPRDADLRREAAAILVAAGEPHRAVKELEAAIQWAPDDPALWVALGEIERDRGQLADAYGAFRRAAELDPDDLEAVSGWALAAEALGLTEEADLAYARWAELEAAKGIEPR